MLIIDKNNRYFEMEQYDGVRINDRKRWSNNT